MPRRPDTRRLTTVLGTATRALALAALSAPALAADYELCGPGFALPPRPLFADPSGTPGAIDVEADEADAREVGVSILRGNVQVRRESSHMSADEVRYDSTTEQVDAIGSLELWGDGVYLKGSRGRMLTAEDVTVVEDAEFRVLEAHAHGSSSELTLLGSDVVKAKDGSYTTCNPGREDWVLRGEDIVLDKVADRGSAYNVWLHFKGMPIFYTPYISFPLSDARKSGFLTPGVGSSSRAGVEATVPYYFNIAPNMDATLAARAMSDRGVQLQGEYRYLFPWGTGRIGVEALGNDKITDQSRTGVSFQHTGSFSPGWSADVDYNWVSDQDYFEDLGTSLSVSSRSFLEQRGDISYSTYDLQALARVQNFQTVDPSVQPADRPYKRLPQLLASTSFAERNLRLNFNGRAEVVYFDRRDSVTGARWDVAPSVTFPYRTAAGYVVPRATLRYTGYSLDDQPAGQRDDPSRVLPTFSLDSGLFFERRFSLASRSLLQTLEPRLFYLFVPYDDQDDLPVFDTGEYTFEFDQLFREDRFNGADRVGDANQLTLAMTSRFLDQRTGAEFARASIGQIRYFRDRKVTLPGEARATSSESALVGALTVNLDQHWRVRAGIQWDPDRSQTDRNVVGLRYQPDDLRVLNVGYRFVRDVVEEAGASFAWPVTPSWRAVGRFDYSLKEDRTVESFAGFEYESCCWGLRLGARRYVLSGDDKYNTGIFAQFVLKGLASAGSADEFLSQSIPGYRNDF